MRTTLDLDDRVLAIARTRARANKTSLGTEVSSLAIETIERGARESAPSADGRFLVFAARPGHLITDEMVADALEDW